MDVVMSTKHLEDNEAEARQLLYRTGCVFMSAGRPGPQTLKNCNVNFLEASRELLVGQC